MAFERTNPSLASHAKTENALVGSGRWLLAMGVAMVMLGVFALMASVATTLLSVILIGGFFIGAAIFQAVFAVTSGRWSGFGLHLLLAVLYGVCGVLLVGQPAMGAATLTLLLAFLFMASGLFRLVGAVVMRFAGWGWVFFGGLVTTLLGIFVAGNLGTATLFLLGTLFGIDAIFIGSQLIGLGVVLRREARQHPAKLRSAYA